MSETPQTDAVMAGHHQGNREFGLMMLAKTLELRIAELEAVVKLVVEWNTEYPSSLIYPEVFEAAKAVLGEQQEQKA